MTPGELVAWLPGVMEDYVHQRVLAGEDEAAARATAAAQTEELAPGGVAAEGQHFFWQRDGDAVVGALWLGRTLQRLTDSWYVYFVVVHDEFRGRGYGRAAMLAAEEWTKRQGARYLGLNVFGHNHVARNLYESLGYETMATQMRKELA
ncbi:MAG: GNAT family N-acetyltransferase [Acidobacteriota bacterium]|nr:GNAT family N-acetyltransferase [Acidobacteriota bacterium]MDE3106997.1 GNAT family N-acetyltransferase [Acidobacteriota bacterium]MDE3222464.1 GNAT family N-acetyltransferase [Acidobacteriota bacterium]